MNNIITSSDYQTYKKSNEAIISFIKQNQEKIDLASYLKATDNDRYSTDNPNVFIKHSTTQFPESLKRDIEKCKMGFLLAINHVWISSGSLLCLWNYVEKTEVFRYECNEAVENVDILKFSNHVELVISTSKHIFLHGIDQTNKKKLIIISSTHINSDGVIMSNFTTTDTRRVFMQGSDGHLYELIIISDTNGLSTSCRIHCHTASPILKYTSYFFRSAPKASVKSMVVDNDEKFLFLLLSDSSIHSVNIQGSSYLPIQRYNATNLESIHLISKTESKQINLMAVSSKGERLYFSCKNKTIDLIYTRSYPPLPGSLLFNNLTNELCELSYYNHGVFAAVLVKSEKKYLLFTTANSIRDGNSNPTLVEDVYNELIGKKIWSVIENSSQESLQNSYFKESLKLSESPARQFATLSTSGITHYTKQRSIDYLSDVLNSNDPSAIVNFLHRYGSVETCALSFLLACSSNSSPEAVQFIRNSVDKDEGLLLHFSKIIEDIWNVDIMQRFISKDQFIEAQERLEKLLLLLQSNLSIKAEIIDLVVRTVGGISFVCFIHDREWDKISGILYSTSTSCSFSDLITTEEGAILLREIVLAAIKTSTAGDESNNYTYISSFLDLNCSHLLGESNITYYKGAECLQAAHYHSNNATALNESLDHFKNIIEFIDLDTLQSLCEENYRLKNHNGAIELAYAKLQTENPPTPKTYSIIFATMADAVQNDDQEQNYSKSVVENALQLSNGEQYHYAIYDWLMEKDHKSILTTLDTPLLVKYFKSLCSPSESLICLHKYHDHRKEYRSAMDCLVDLATKIPNITLDTRLTYLRIACDYLTKIDDISAQEKKTLKLTYDEAEVQLSLYYTLLTNDTTKPAAKQLESSLQPADTLLNQFAYKYELHEQALRLLHILEQFDYSYVKKAWTCIIKECKSQEKMKDKFLDLAERIYPSITSFPVYTIYDILKKYHPGHADTLLVQAVPELKDLIIERGA
ncbi:Nup133 N terminal like-domain-containing protein [Thamnidium elegans]|nr:Nup133 N terminal like-domain-containing protein [Thamnidium elegans]